MINEMRCLASHSHRVNLTPQVFHVEQCRNMKHSIARERSPMSTQQKNKPRLGRGLSSLISISELPVEAEVTSKPSSTLAPQSPPSPAIHSAPPTALTISQ